MSFGLRLLIVAALFFGGFFVRYNVRRNNKRVILIALLFGGGAAIAALILNAVAQHVFHFPDALNPRVHPTTRQLVVSTAVFVSIEETVKFVPLAFFLLGKKYFNLLSDGILYFGLAGLMFGSIEHFIYGIGYGEVTLLVRIFLVLFLHAGLTGMVGYFYAKDRLLGNRYRTWLAFLAAIVLHYIYDLCLFLSNRKGPFLPHLGLVLVSGAIATGLNCLLVWLFYVSSQRDWARVQQPVKQ